MNNYTQLTIQQALEAGYTYSISKRSGSVFKIENILRLHTKSSPIWDYMFVCDVEPIHYTLNADTIAEIIGDHIFAQDEVSDDDLELAGIALEGTDNLLKALADKINENLKSKDFYYPSNIKLIP